MSLSFDDVIPFLLVLSIVVFVHEWGHYWVARRNGVRVEVFSIGFGREIFGWTDAHETRWKISLIPLGGYVRMLGDADASSSTIDLSKAQDEESFPAKSVWQRIAIVAAGPAANFIFAIIVWSFMLAVRGEPVPLAAVGTVVDDSPAMEAGLLEGDRILAVDGIEVTTFADLKERIVGAGESVLLQVGRDGQELELSVQPRVNEQGDRLIGVGADAEAVRYDRVSPLMAPFEATYNTFAMVGGILGSIGEMITGERNAGELGGPLRIAQLSGEAAERGLWTVVWFVIIISINLGLINLFPIPVLDGGHLVFYAVEAVRGRPVPERGQEIAFRFGLAMVLGLMVFATWNDLVNLKVVEFLTSLVS